ncbi:NAD(P)H-dependent flavin oxidoreductase [Dethiobacter alkaliphilus]|uniref:NAD(P)H-dependent flavin oxidoreductase n=1 Tax=Dethiobacter alkaliphilus TaxID=427926 RepID=UPI002226D8DD|nr:nitronate monooxygenase [Dethiobacter alkaliphilus]MCW3491447.1 nitronate monooxygenase [Dethiobacter alkaliphilus]
MLLPQLNIGNLKVKIPIIQGGMAVRVSTAKLAAAVANEGGAGVIAGTGLSVQALQEEIRKARELTSGIIGVNVLFAASQFAQLVRTAMKERVDFIVSGAGFSRDIFAWGKEMNVPVLSMVSSARVAKLAEKMGAAAVIVEGKEAGGHLGTDRSVFDLLKEVVGSVKIPVIAAGGIMDGYDIKKALDYGADGVQMATRFVASTECEASDKFKDLYLNSRPEDSVLIDSPVGLPGRALRNQLTERLAADKKLPLENCDSCLKKCSHAFCILDALEKAVDGDVENGLVFSGEYFHKIKEILPVSQIMKQLIAEYEEAQGDNPRITMAQ